MIHGKQLPFQKNEDEHTIDGWIRVDKQLPGWGQKVSVLGYHEKSPDTMHEDIATIINTGNGYMFWTTEWIAPQFVVLYWR